MGGNTLASSGVHNFTSYDIRNANTDASGTFVFRQAIEKFCGKSRQILSGLDSLASDLLF